MASPQATSPVIAGFAESRCVVKSGRTVYDLAGEVFANLLDKCGITNRDVDGFAVCQSLAEAGNPFWSATVSEYLGLELDWCQGVDLGGSSFCAAVARASDAIRSGACSTVVVLVADAPTGADRSQVRLWRPEWQDPVGLMGPPGAFGLLSSAYQSRYGLDRHALGRLAVTQRSHALLNDNACDKLRKPLSIEDYLASPMISDPICLLDCVMRCDGANAVLVTSEGRAAELGLRKLARPVGYGERTHHRATDPLADMTVTGHRVAATRALSQAGMTISDIDMLQAYDDFLIAVLLQMEQIGFCPEGGGCEFLLDTDLSFSGTLPVNTGGGQISAGQPGLAGSGLGFVEAVRQLFGEGGGRQVPDANNAMVSGLGWIPYGRNWSVSNVMILERCQ
jgi:acetyl-CoA acetyltransferase